MTAAGAKGTAKEESLLEAEIAKIQRTEQKRAKKKKHHTKHVPTTTTTNDGKVTGPSKVTAKDPVTDTAVPRTSDAVQGSQSSPSSHVDDTDSALLDAEIAKSATRIMKHMNTDHEDSLMAYVLAFATGIEDNDVDPTSAADDDVKKDQTRLLHNIRHGNNQLVLTAAQLTKVDRMGFVLEIHAIDENQQRMVLSRVRVPFDVPITAAREIHHVAVRMHRQAYDTLGIVYKLQTGYYQQVVQFVAVKAYKTLQHHRTPTTVVVVAAGVLAVSTIVMARHRSRTTTTKQ